jgi:hypothetical protein
MDVGEEIDIWALNLSIWNDIPNVEFKYHSIHTTCWPGDPYDWPGDPSDGKRIYLKRTKDDTWTLFVENAYFEAYENYREYINPGTSHSYIPLRTACSTPVWMQIDWKKIIVE